MITEGHAMEAVGWISTELAGRAGAWEGEAPNWFPDPPDWIELWQRALKETHKDEDELEQELTELINRYCIEDHSDTPDYILAKFLTECLAVWHANVRLRDRWFGFEPWKDATVSKES